MIVTYGEGDDHDSPYKEVDLLETLLPQAVSPFFMV